MTSENIYWRNIPPHSIVELRGEKGGQVYMVSWLEGRNIKGGLVYWEGREASEAQRFLDKLVEANKKE